MPLLDFVVRRYLLNLIAKAPEIKLSESEMLAANTNLFQFLTVKSNIITMLGI